MCIRDRGKAQALAIRTESEFSIVKRLQEETAEALRLLDEGKRFPFGGAHNIVAAVKHAQLGAVLEAETLMEIGSTAAVSYTHLVGVLDVEPSSINVVPGKATLWVDLRGVDEESINCALSDIRDAVSEIAKNDSITITMDMLTADNPVALSEELLSLIHILQN